MSIDPRLRGSREPWVLQKKAFIPIGLHLKSIVSVGLLWNLCMSEWDSFGEDAWST